MQDNVAQAVFISLKISTLVETFESGRKKTFVKGNISQDVFCIIKSFSWDTNPEFNLSYFPLVHGRKSIHVPAQRER